MKTYKQYSKRPSPCLLQNRGGGGTIIEPSIEDIVIPAYTDTDLTIRGDKNLIPGNIRYGKNIFGVSGTYGGAPIEYTYTGQSQITYDQVTIGGISALCFTLNLLSSGTLNIKQIGVPHTDIYVVGGGGGGAGATGSYWGGGGGAGAYLTRAMDTALPKDTDMQVVIGAGGSAGLNASDATIAGGNGGRSSILGITANGGGGAGLTSNLGYNHKGGDGGSGGGAGEYQTNRGEVGHGDGHPKNVLGALYCGGGAGANYMTGGGPGGFNGGNGYTTATKPNELVTGQGGAGGGGSIDSWGTPSGGVPNTGGGGGGASAAGGNGAPGGAGIIIIRGRYE